MRPQKRVPAMLITLLLLCALALPAYAHEVPDLSRSGTLTVEMRYDGGVVAGGTLTAYRVGRIQESDGNYTFEKTDAMQAFAGDYAEVASADLAEKVAAFVRQNGIAAYATANNENGAAVFKGLELGLYLIVQTHASDGYEPLQPFLVSVPMVEDGVYLYEINAEGKFQLKQASRPTPTPPAPPAEESAPSKPSGTVLPQTGQMNWPVPVLAMLGLCLIVIGWGLRSGKRANGNEA